MINVIREPLIFEISSPGKSGVRLPALDVPENRLPWKLCLSGQTLRDSRKCRKQKSPGILPVFHR